MSGLASTHWAAAAAGSMPSLSTRAAISFCCSVVNWKLLDELERRRVLLLQPGGGRLVQHVRRVVAVVRAVAGSRRGIALVGHLGERDLRQLDLRVQPVRLPEVEEQRLAGFDCLLDGGDLRRLGAGDDELQRELEVGDDLLVVADVARVTHEELAPVAGLGGGEQLRQLGSFNPSHVDSSGCSSSTDAGTYQPILATGPSSPMSTTVPLSVT